MNSFKNHSKRNRYRQNGDRHFKKRNGELHKFKSDYSSNINFQRKSPGRNNHNASKLVEKYNDLAREALSKGDKILSENYFQHADHFARILSQKENYKLLKNKEDNSNDKISESVTLTSKDEEEQEKPVIKS
tara:strand:- start:1459 stop:1854 length:396 start_codon:yes stop_codon:yes gene_type:complete